MVNCFQFCSNFAFKFKLRRYTMASKRAALEAARNRLTWHARWVAGRGLHSSTSHLNLSRF